MKEFVNGTDQQYALLKDSLEDHLCHVYKNCAFPPGCSRPTGRIGFEKGDAAYALFIDKGITYTGRNAPSLFRDWLATGTLRFLDFSDIKDFLRSLRCLY